MSATLAPRRIELIEVTALDADAQMRIRDIRNEDSIRAAMYTDHVIGVDEHRQWLEKLKHDPRQIVFGIIDPERGPLGVASVSALDLRHQKSDWTFWITQGERGGLGSAIELAMIEFAFETLGLEKLNCEVIEGNEPVLKLHHKFMFEQEGFRKSNIIKNGQRIGAHFLGLQKAVWQQQRAALLEKYRGVFERFEIVIRWSGQI